MKVDKTITREMMELMSVPSEQIDESKFRFGDDIEFTKELCESAAQVFNWDIVADHFLNSRERKMYFVQNETLMKKYFQNVTPFWDSYSHQHALLSITLGKQRDAYEAQNESLWKELRSQIAPMLEQYNRQRAALFWELYGNTVSS